MTTYLKSTFTAALFLVAAFLIPASANAAEINVYNNADEAVSLYLDDGHGWEFYQKIPANRRRSYDSVSGETWGFAKPYARKLTIVRERTVKQWGNNSLTVTNRDIGNDDHDGHDHDDHDDHNQGRPDINPLNNTVTIVNNSSLTVDVYADRGNGWHKEATLRSRSRKNFHAYRGDDWGIDNPDRRGVNIVKSLTIKNFDLLPSLSVYDQDFGINNNQFLPAKTITITNRSDHAFDVYVDHKTGHGWHKEGSVAAGRSQKFPAKTGEQWAVDNPVERGIKALKATTIRDFGFHNITVTEEDIHGRHHNGGGRPVPAPPREVRITFKNKSIHKANVSVKTGLFSKSYLGTIKPFGKTTYKLTPGRTVIINRPGEFNVLKYTVPSENSYLEFKPR